MTGFIYGDWPYDPARDMRYHTGLKKVDVVAYELPLETTDGTTGRVTIAGTLDGDYSYRIFVIDGKLYHIKQCESSDGVNTVLQVGDDASVFDDGMKFARTGSFYQLLNTFFESEGSASHLDWSSQGLLYGRPQLYTMDIATDVKAYLQGITDFDKASLAIDEMPDPTTGGLYAFSMAKTVRMARMYGVNMSFKCTDDRIILTADSINDYTRPTPVFDKDGHTRITSATFSNAVTSYVRIFGKNAEADSPGVTFVNKNGVAYEIANTDRLPDNRYGYRVNAFKDDDKTALEQAQAIIDGDKIQHKIVFESDLKMHIGQPVTVILPRGNYHSVITSVFKTTASNRLTYTCGELPTTASDLIRANSWAYGNLPPFPRKGDLVFIKA